MILCRLYTYIGCEEKNCILVFNSKGNYKFKVCIFFCLFIFLLYIVWTGVHTYIHIITGMYNSRLFLSHTHIHYLHQIQLLHKNKMHDMAKVHCPMTNFHFQWIRVESKALYNFITIVSESLEVSRYWTENCEFSFAFRLLIQKKSFFSFA